jgi:hypothetical protein
MLKEQTPKKHTFDNYYRFLMDVYNHFKLNNIHKLLRTNENEIIKYIETKCKKTQTQTDKAKDANKKDEFEEN